MSAPILFQLVDGYRDPKALRDAAERAAKLAESDRLENRCACGCGTKLIYKGNRVFRFIRGHNLPNVRGVA